MINSNVTALIARLQARIQMLRPDSEILHKALTRIALAIQLDAQRNARQNFYYPHRGIRTGRLLNSIQYEFFNEQGIPGVKVGSFGVPYAATQEFGFRGAVSIRGHKRLIQKVFGRQIEPREIFVRPHVRQANIPARPFLRPAVAKNRDFIIDVLREAARGGT